MYRIIHVDKSSKEFISPACPKMCQKNVAVNAVNPATNHLHRNLWYKPIPIGDLCFCDRILFYCWIYHINKLFYMNMKKSSDLLVIGFTSLYMVAVRERFTDMVI